MVRQQPADAMLARAPSQAGLKTAPRAAEARGARGRARPAPGSPQLEVLRQAPPDLPLGELVERLSRGVAVLQGAMTTLEAAPILRVAIGEIREEVDELGVAVRRSQGVSNRARYADDDDRGGARR